MKKWPKSTKIVRGKPLLFAQFLPFSLLFGNGSKSPKNTLGVVENDSKACTFYFWNVFKKLKKWPKSTKMIRGYPLLFARFSPYFQLFENASKTPKTTLGVVENNSKVFWLCLWRVFKVENVAKIDQNGKGFFFFFLNDFISMTTTGIAKVT